MKVVLTARAQDDLIDIWVYISDESPRAADAVLDRIGEKLNLLEGFPQMGAARDDIRAGLRMLPSDSFLVLYRILDTEIEVVRVIHGARNLDDVEF